MMKVYDDHTQQKKDMCVFVCGKSGNIECDDPTQLCHPNFKVSKKNIFSSLIYQMLISIKKIFCSIFFAAH